MDADLNQVGKRRYLARRRGHSLYALGTGQERTIDWLSINTMRKLSRVCRLWCEIAFELAWPMERSSFYSGDRPSTLEIVFVRVKYGL